MVELQYDKDKISLSLSESTDLSQNRKIVLDLMADDPDDSDENTLEVFQNIFYDLVMSFSKGHIVLYSSKYKQIKSESKSWIFGHWKPGKYNTKGETSKLKNHLVETNWDKGIYADIIDYYQYKLLWQSVRHYTKNLFILQENLDINLLKKTDMSHADEGNYGNDISIFSDSKLAKFDEAESIIQCYRKEKQPIIYILTEVVLPRIYISVDTEYIQKEQCIEVIKQLAKKYNKILEVNI